MIRVSSLSVAFLCAILVLAGCNEPKKIGGVEAKVTYRRIVSLSPSSTEIASLAPFCQIAGRTASCDWPPTILSAPVVMKGVKPDYESIIKMGPDAVFYDADIIPAADLKKLEEANIPLVATDGGTTLDGFKENLKKIGTFVHGESAYSKYIDQIDQSVAQARVNTLDPKPKVAVLLPSEGKGEHMIAGSDSFPAMLVKVSGGEFVGPAGRVFVPLNAESLVKLNPDVIISGGVPDSILNDPRLKAVTAIIKKRVSGFAPAVLLRKGQRVNMAIKNMSAIIIDQMKKE